MGKIFYLGLSIDFDIKRMVKSNAIEHVFRSHEPRLRYDLTSPTGPVYLTTYLAFLMGLAVIPEGACAI